LQENFLFLPVFGAVGLHLSAGPDNITLLALESLNY
jgi:hypothetical protein